MYWIEIQHGIRTQPKTVQYSLLGFDAWLILMFKMYKTNYVMTDIMSNTSRLSLDLSQSTITCKDTPTFAQLA